MIVKPRKVPLKIEILEALLRRLPFNHPKIPTIQTALTNRKAGYKGELESDYHLSLLPEKDYFILHDIRLPHNDTFFQIDSLIICPGFILILDVKNFYGTIHLHPKSDQMVREYEGKEQGFSNPLVQAKRHLYLFHN
ncbi:nuclease-related domain-containing protein [Mesobacillus zeae]|uniref:nuclease-related domain-containing protein n=1 Tax=Mesobacillus zeae TaxID=1917180 RepID=UPI0015E67867|nr:nuclease-related domain-containing protein [Mesobacillus zeae]